MRRSMIIPAETGSLAVEGVRQEEGGPEAADVNRKSRPGSWSSGTPGEPNTKNPVAFASYMQRSPVRRSAAPMLGLLVLLLPAGSPQSVLPGFHVVQVTGGGGFTCAVTADERAWCWGDNRYGQLGQGFVDPTAATMSHFIPLEVPVPSAVEVRGGLTGAVCARAVTGAAYCWGNLYTGINPTPTPIGGLSSVAQLAVGSRHVCALKTDGTVACWGDNAYGQLGTGSSAYSSTPVPAAITSVASITAGYWHTCATKTDGSAWCWGRNLDGQVGKGAWSIGELAPTRVVALTVAASVSAGGWHTCARNATDDSVWCWGGNWWGQAGDGTLSDRFTPARVAQLLTGLGPDDQGTWLATGWMHSCAGKLDTTAWCWGNADYGQLGSGEWGIVPGRFETRPVRVALDGFGGAAGAGSFHMCASQADGRLYCWGDNHNGQSGYLNPQQPVLGSLCFNHPSCTWSVPMPVVSRRN